MPPTPIKKFLGFRPTQAMADEVRTIAEREGETQSCIIRRALRLGLQSMRTEGRSTSPQTAEAR